MESTEFIESTATAEVIAPATAVRTRIDPRTGKQMEMHSASFWREHEAQRQARGQSIRRYCEEQGLALSTFRRWSCQIRSGERARPNGQAPSTQPPFLSMPIRGVTDDRRTGASADALIELHTRGGLRVSLYGAAGERAIQAVMAELAGTQ